MPSDHETAFEGNGEHRVIGVAEARSGDLLSIGAGECKLITLQYNLGQPLPSPRLKYI